jgi:hypothetical protein
VNDDGTSAKNRTESSRGKRKIHVRPGLLPLLPFALFAPVSVQYLSNIRAWTSVEIVRQACSRSPIPSTEKLARFGWLAWFSRGPRRLIRTLWTSVQASTRNVRSGCLGGRLQFDVEAEPGELSDVMPGFGLARTAVEMIGAEVLMVGTVLAQAGAARAAFCARLTVSRSCSRA